MRPSPVELEGLAWRTDRVVVAILGSDQAGDAVAGAQHEVERRSRQADQRLGAVPPDPLGGRGSHLVPYPRSWKKNSGRAPSITSWVIFCATSRFPVRTAMSSRVTIPARLPLSTTGSRRTRCCTI